MFNKVLIIEDTKTDWEDLIESLSIFINRDDIEVIDKLEDALSRIDCFVSPNVLIVVFVDIWWHGKKTGLKLAESIRRNHPNIKLVAFTTSVEDTIIEELYGKFDAFVDKNSGAPHSSSIKISDIDNTFLERLANGEKLFQERTEGGDSTPVLYNNNEKNSVNYAIITALEEDEMEVLLPMIEREGKIDNNIVLTEYGFLKANPSKKLVYASQPSTGMIDAAILATELIIKYNPKILIMAGVLGGKPGDVNIGDIVVATRIFTIDKGKLTEEELLKEIESTNTESSFVSVLKRNRKDIVKSIEESDKTRKKRLEVHFGPVACVRQVIDKEKYFEDKILINERKAIALEMESYGVARACEIANNGKTVPLIIKSAMDNTAEKIDDEKRYAAWTSAMFVKYILENNLI